MAFKLYHLHIIMPFHAIGCLANIVFIPGLSKKVPGDLITKRTQRKLSW